MIAPHPNPANAPTVPPPAPRRRFSAALTPRVCALLCMGLGLAVLCGWALDIAAIKTALPGGAPMQANTALGFVLLGGALLALATGRARRAGLVAALGVLALGLATLAEHGFAIDLGIDQLLFSATDAPGARHPGRMAPRTSIGLTAAGLALVCAALAGSRHWLLVIGRALALGIMVLGTLGLVAYLLNLDFLISSPTYELLARHTAAGFAVLGLGLFSALQPRTRPEDQRIAGLAGLLLVIAAGATGLASFATIGHQAQDTLAQGLSAALAAHLREITTNIALRTAEAEALGSRPGILEPLRALTADPGDARTRARLAEELASLLPHGFSGVAVTLPSGAEMARAGALIAAPALAVRGRGATGGTLLWHDSLHLRHRLVLADAAGPLGSALIEQSLPNLTAFLRAVENQWASSEFLLCAPAPGAFHCLPSRAQAQPFTLAAAPAKSPPLPLTRALAEGRGFAAVVDQRGKSVLAAYSRLDALGLVAVLQVDAAEIYAPASRSFTIAALLTMLLASVGALLVQLRVRPLAARLVQAEAETRRHYQEMHTSTALLRSVFADSPDAILVVDASGRIVEASPRTQVLFGHPVAALLDQPIEVLLPERYRAAHPGHRAHFNAAPHARPMGSGLPLYARRADGSEFPVDVVLSPLQDGAVGRTIAIVRDISERKQAEEALQRSNQELEEFAYAASHDLKEPLRGIHNYAQFLTEDYADRLDDPGRERLQALMRLTERMEALIDALLQFSRAGRVELAMAATDLGSVLAEVLDSLAATLAERGVEVRVPVPLPVVHCDRVRIGQVFHNLIGNALKYNDKDAKWVEIGWHEAAGELVFQVRDNGIGIAAKHREAIFRIFKRLHGRDRYGGGSGVGLALVKKIVERHGGRIWVESEPGVGSTFYFTLGAQAQPA